MVRKINPEFIDVTLVLHHTTARAYCVSETGDLHKSFWLPRSQVDIVGLTSMDGVFLDSSWKDVVTFAVPYWLAKKENLV